MTTYKELYLFLFNTLTDAIEELEHGSPLRALLAMKQAQQTAEECHLEVDVIPER